MRKRPTPKQTLGVGLSPAELQEVIGELDPQGESAQWLNAMAAQLIREIDLKSFYGIHFGDASAKEVILRCLFPDNERLRYTPLVERQADRIGE